MSKSSNKRTRSIYLTETALASLSAMAGMLGEKESATLQKLVELAIRITHKCTTKSRLIERLATGVEPKAKALPVEAKADAL